MKKYNLNINKASILSSNINTFRINGIQNNSKRIIKSSSNSQNVLYNNEIIKKINTNKNSRNYKFKYIYNIIVMN